MTTEPESLTNSYSPLRGFDFTRDWAAGREFPRRYLPAAEELISKRLTALDGGSWKPWSPEEVAELREFNSSFGNNAGAALADHLLEKDALVVVTGQQPDLLVSPLYVLHKALSARAWADKLAKEQNRRIVPVFWVASDDDDFAELKEARLVTWKGELVDVGARVSRGKGLSAGTPAYSWTLADSAERLKQDIRQALQGWPGGKDNAEILNSELDAYPGFEASFCRLLTLLLGSHAPVLFVAPRLSAFRKRQAEILAEDVEQHSNVNAEISQAASKFQQAGYSVTLQREPEAMNFFWINNDRRHRLVNSEGSVVAFDPQHHKPAATLSPEELSRLLRNEPHSFAPNVVTRPLVQDVALPTVAYVAGPGELAYLAVLGAAYTAAGIVRSAIIPRTLVTLDPQGVLRDWSGIDPPEHAADAVLTRGGGSTQILLDQIADLMSDTALNIERMRLAAAGERAEVHLALDKTERHLMKGIEQLKRRLARQAAPEEWARVARISALMSPAGNTQERTLSPWNFVCAADWAALGRHLTDIVDYTAVTPQTAPMPSWMQEALA